MNHLISQIATLGREQVLKHLKSKGIQPDKEDIITDRDTRARFYLVISTKRYKSIDTSKCTGMNDKRIATIEEKVKKLNADGAYLVFVDAKLGICYGGYLSKLQQPKEFDGIRWPLTQVGPAGRITYWSVFHMQTLFTLDAAVVSKLDELGSDNKYDKTQGKLF